MIDEYLDELAAQLRLSARHRARVVDEMRDHLVDAVADLESRGVSPRAAAEQAVGAFGRPAQIAQELNAQAATAVMRRAPLVIAASAAALVGGFLLAALTQPRPAVAPAAPAIAQISFFLAVLGLQVAAVAGARGASLAAVHWRSGEAPAADRALAARAEVIAAGALLVTALGWTLAVVAVIARHRVHAHAMAAAAGCVVMVAAALSAVIAVTRAWRRLAPVDSLADLDDDAEFTRRATTGVAAMGEHAVRFVRQRPVAACVVVAVVAALGAMSHAETSVPLALVWGAIEALAVVAGFVLLGPCLGLRARTR